MAVGQPFVGLQWKRVLVYTGSASGHIYFTPFPPLHALPLRVMETVWRPTLRSHAKITPALLTSMEAKAHSSALPLLVLYFMRIQCSSYGVWAKPE